MDGKSTSHLIEKQRLVSEKQIANKIMKNLVKLSV